LASTRPQQNRSHHPRQPHCHPSQSLNPPLVLQLPKIEPVPQQPSKPQPTPPKKQLAALQPIKIESPIVLKNAKIEAVNFMCNYSGLKDTANLDHEKNKQTLRSYAAKKALAKHPPLVQQEIFKFMCSPALKYQGVYGEYINYLESLEDCNVNSGSKNNLSQAKEDSPNPLNSVGNCKCGACLVCAPRKF
jgi:hypothetical protein